MQDLVRLSLNIEYKVQCILVVMKKNEYNMNIIKIHFYLKKFKTKALMEPTAAIVRIFSDT